MNKRPFTVTIIGWIFIAAGAIGFVHHLTEIHLRQPFQSENFWILLLSLVAVVSGVFINAGQQLGTVAGAGMDCLPRISQLLPFGAASVGAWLAPRGDWLCSFPSRSESLL